MASTKYIRTARKLQNACKKVFGVKLLIDQRQWYHKDRDTALTVYTLYQAMIDENDKRSKVKLFQTYSQVQLVLFMRDFWYNLNGWEIPTNNKVWEGIKQKYGEKEEPTDEEPTDKPKRSERAERNRTAICDELYQNWESDNGG